MVDNDPNNKEYKLDDLDLLASEPEEQFQSEDEVTDFPSEPSKGGFGDSKPWENPMVRKGAIGLGGFVLVFLCYKMIHAVWGDKTSTNQIKPVAIQQNTPKPQPIQSAANLVTDDLTSKKLSSLEQAQGNMSDTLQTVNNQVTSMNSEISDVSSKITTLSANLAALNEKLDAQTQEIARLTALNAKRHVVKHEHRLSSHNPSNAPDVYSIQALIPGRAWLISSNGSSMTVREGSALPGYGVVKLIDVERGRVLMSSGRVIKFGQVDS